MNDGFSNLTDWQLGLTTPAPTTTKSVPTVGPKSTAAATTKAKAPFELDGIDGAVNLFSSVLVF